ncbi:MAG: TonB-dependent receptor [Verrucomicrobiota bacterium]
MPSRLHCFIAMTCALLGAVGGRAQEADGAGDLVELPDFTASAYTFGIEADDFPGQVAVFDRTFLEDQAVPSLAELLEVHAGIPLRSTSGNRATATVDLRGYGENSGLRTLILVDGLPLNRADMSAPSWLEVPLGNVDRVEILRGPQTARFGDFAVGGVINIITRLDPGDAPETEVAGGVGTDGLRWARLRHSRPLGSGALSTALDRNQTDGYRDNGGYAASSLSLNYGRATPGGGELRLGLLAVDDEIEFPGPVVGAPGGGFPEDPRRTPYGELADQFFSEGARLQGAGSWIQPLAEGALRLTSRTGAAWQQREANFGPGSHSDNTQRQARLSSHLQRKSEHRSWGLGLAGTYHGLEVVRWAEQTRQTALGEATLDRSSAAIFADAGWSPLESLELTGALRLEMNRLEGRSTDRVRPQDPRLNFDRGRTSDGTAAQLGLLFRPVPGLRLWTRYDRLYRFPVADEVAFYQGLPSSRPFNDELEPETGHNLEFGGEFVGRGWSLQANSFVQRLDGAITYDFLLNENRNFADVDRHGLELRLRLEGDRWSFNAGGTWLEATYADGRYGGNSVPLVPSHTLQAVGALEPLEHWQLTAEVVHHAKAYEGSDYANTQPVLPAWTVLNLQSRFALSPATSLYLRLDNAFDHAYATVKFTGTWYPMPGRQFRAGVRHRF